MMEFRQAEVLVIGGGIAGMRASLAAREGGASVTLLSKRKIGKAGASLVANTGHRIFSSTLNPEFDNLKETYLSGQGLAVEDLVEVLAAESYDAVKELKDWGCPIDFEYHPAGIEEGIVHYARCSQRKGLLITQVLRQRCEETNIALKDGFTVIKLIRARDRIIGAYAIHQDQIYCFLAKAVILATGGIGQLYQSTDNPIDQVGETLALAWEVGAKLMDLEFVQFYPYQLQSPVSMDIHTSVFRLGAYLLNEQGDRFMEEYPKQELETRDLVSREMFLQDGDIYLDLMDADLDELKKTNPNLLKLYFKDQDLLVSPIQHFFMGGVKMDVDGRSSIPGLYVCGEAATGVHGANRLGGNALTECSVFGRRAGLEAAQETKGLEFSLEEIDQVWLKDQLVIPKLGEDQYLTMQIRLQHIMWEAVGIVRDGLQIRKALKEIRKKRVFLEKSKPGSLVEWYQMKNMLIAAQLIAEAALMRQESRGAHYRLDYPETDPQWKGHIVVERDQFEFQKKFS